MRVGYAFMGVGLAIVKWPVPIQDVGSLPVMDGVVICLLTAMSLLAFLGLRYPARMLPILDLDRAILTIERSRTTAGYQIVEGDPRTRPAVERSPSTSGPYRYCAPTAAANSTNAATPWPTAAAGSTPGTCSSAPTGCRSTRPTPPHDSENSSNAPAYRRCGCTTCGMALRC
jgi:hypothetical protein